MKGYLYTLEVLVAISLVFGALFFIYRSPPPKPDFQTSLIKQGGFEAIRYLDERGDLRKYVNQSNETAVEDALESILPKSVGFEVSICGLSCDTEGIPSNRTTIAVDYYVSGYRNIFDPKRVRIYLWEEY